MARFEGQVWTDLTTTEYFVVYFDNTRADGWVGLHNKPTEVEVKTLKGTPGRCTPGSPPWWAARPSYRWEISYFWDP